MVSVGYCPTCRAFYPNREEPYRGRHEELHFSCPKGHDLLQPLRCGLCETVVAFFTLTDSYVSVEEAVCSVCAYREENNG